VTTSNRRPIVILADLCHSDTCCNHWTDQDSAEFLVEQLPPLNSFA